MKKGVLWFFSLSLCLVLIGCPAVKKLTNGYYVPVSEDIKHPSYFKWDFKKGTAALKVYEKGNMENVLLDYRFSVNNLTLGGNEDREVYQATLKLASEPDLKVEVEMVETKTTHEERYGVAHLKHFEVTVRHLVSDELQGEYTTEYNEYDYFEKTPRGMTDEELMPWDDWDYKTRAYRYRSTPGVPNKKH